jgi:hypothetical protein
MEMDLILSRDSITTPVKKKKKTAEQQFFQHIRHASSDPDGNCIFVMLALTQTAIAYPNVKKGNTQLDWSSN